MACRARLAVSPLEGLEGGPLVCLGGLSVLVEEGLAVLRWLVAIPQIGV